MQFNRQKYSSTYLLKVFVIITLIVSVLGYIDSLSGEASIDTLYIACVGAVTWHTSRTIGVLCLLEIILAKTWQIIMII